MMAIYEKALRRREVMAPPSTSTTTASSDSKEGEERDQNTNEETNTAAATSTTQQTEEEAKKNEEAEKKKAAAQSADIGKIVNLMSTDTTSIERMIYMSYFFYGAPFTLIIAVFWLYELLGWSAFAGVGIFVVIAPLNHVISGRTVKVWADMQAARDKKMSVLNEMVSEIKFIKFLADEERWLKRAMDVRAAELKLIRQSGYLDIALSFIWHACPIGVSILSFWAYIWSGHRLTVSTAFTAVQLFAMLGGPLGALPMVLVQYFRLQVSINRIANFLSEPEVDEAVSSFKNDGLVAPRHREGTDQTLVEESRLGILNGYFYWSKPEEVDPEVKKAEEATKAKKPWYRRKFWARTRAVVEPAPVAEILVTHHVELVLPAAGYLVRMLDGRIDTQRSISELRKRGLLQEITAKAKKEEEKADVSNESQEEDHDAKKDKGGKPAKKLIEEEKRAEGRMGLGVYVAYIKASAYITWIGLIFFIVLETSMSIGEKAWMQVWGEAYGRPSLTLTAFLHNSQGRRSSMFPVANFVTDQVVASSSLPDADEHPMFYVGVFAAIGFASILLEMCASTILVFGAYRASRILFQRLLEGITRATMRWHDTTPTGRILNRMSKDFETIDTTIATSFSYTITSLSMVALSVLTIIVISPFFLIPGALIALGYIYISNIYLRVTRPLKRLDSTTISPIYASFRVTLEGLSTIRAFSAERRFLNIMIRKLDVTTKCYYTYWMVNRWALARFDALGGFTVFAVMVLVAIFGGKTQTQSVNILGVDLTAFQGKAVASSGFEGLLIVSAMGFTMYIYWACRFISQLELDLNSVERINEYLTVPQEPPAVIESARPPAYWPSSGDSSKDLISVEDLVIKYAPDLPSVLQGVSFKVKGQERVGLVGRTGSGKSTLATALLRFVEPASGRIIIDGIDISSIGLYDLRSRVTFIQQDSVLFSGTIRENLDPFNEHTDAECLDVLRRVHLIDSTTTPSRPASVFNDGSDPQPSPSPSSIATGTEVPERTAAIKLDSIVTSSGSNFSHGQ
ncbi:hypothetical protein FRC17_003352, partial [Serendipita sp. 399]